MLRPGNFAQDRRDGNRRAGAANPQFLLFNPGSELARRKPGLPPHHPLRRPRHMIAQKEKRLESSGRYARLSRRRPVKRPNSCSVNLLCTAKNSPKTNPCLPMALLFFTHPTNRTHQIPRIRRIRPILQTQRLGQLPIVAPKLPLPPVSPGTMPRAA